MDHNGTTTHFLIESRGTTNRWTVIAQLPEADDAEAYLERLQAAMPESTYRLVQVETTRRIIAPLEV